MSARKRRARFPIAAVRWTAVNGGKIHALAHQYHYPERNACVEFASLRWTDPGIVSANYRSFARRLIPYRDGTRGQFDR